MMNLNGGDSIEDLFDFTAGSTQQYPCMDFVVGGDMVYGDSITSETSLGAETDVYRTTQFQDAAMQGNNGLIEDPMRKVSLVVDECDGNTLDYLKNVMRPLKGKVRLEMNL